MKNLFKKFNGMKRMYKIISSLNFKRKMDVLYSFCPKTL